MAKQPKPSLPPKPPLPPKPTAKSKEPKISTDNSTNNGIKKGTMLYVPRQVFMSDNFHIADNLSSTQTVLLEEPKVIKKNLNVVATENGKRELQISSNSETWSPLMDHIIKDLPTSVSGNSSLSNGKTAKGSKKVDERMVLDEYIEKILHGPGTSSLPVFEKLCRE